MMRSTPADRRPWFKFYGQDWRGDAALRGCSRSARGLWIDLLTLMHEADPYGELRISGQIPSTKRLASMLGGTEKDMASDLRELEENGVLSRREDGAIYSRRMVRDHDKLLKDTENGKSGGNPALSNESSNTSGGSDKGGVNPPIKLTHKPRARASHIPEARDQKERELPSEATPKSRRGTTIAYSPEFEEFWGAYPARPNDNKRSAADAYARALRDVSPGFLLDALRAYRFPADPQFIRHAATWLNGRSWEDRDVAIAAPAAIVRESVTDRMRRELKLPNVLLDLLPKDMLQ